MCRPLFCVRMIACRLILGKHHLISKSEYPPKRYAPQARVDRADMHGFVTNPSKRRQPSLSGGICNEALWTRHSFSSLFLLYVSDFFTEKFALSLSYGNKRVNPIPIQKPIKMSKKRSGRWPCRLLVRLDANRTHELCHQMHAQAVSFPNFAIIRNS